MNEKTGEYTVEGNIWKATIKPNEIIVVEGSHALAFPKLNEIADLKIFNNVSDDRWLMWKIGKFTD